MKKQLSLLVLFFSLFLSSCSHDSKTATTNSLSGAWKLTNVSGTFAGIHDDFTPGLITWTFNATNSTVTVVNNNTDPNKWDILDTGVYPYHFVNTPDMPCSQSLDINGTVYGCYTITNGSLVIDQSIADGFAITLKQ